jgi:NH3-dependent NAD+ synthetase
MDPRLQTIIDWIRQTTAPDRGVLVPVSGGSDSALCYWLCHQALPGRALAAYVGADVRCRPWFDAIRPVQHLPLPPAIDGVLPEAQRWAMMLSLARTVHGWVVGSRNRTEDVLGTYSLASRAATYLPLAGLWKSEVMELCELVGVPAEIIRSSREADPPCGRPQEMADIAFADVDLFLQVETGERPREHLARLTPACVEYLTSVLRRNAFKRDLPLRPPVSAHTAPE